MSALTEEAERPSRPTDRSKVFSHLRIAMVLVCLVLGLTVAACGDDEDEGDGGAESAQTTGGSDSGGDAGLEKAQALVEKESQPPTDVGYDVPLPKKPPSGKTIAVLEVPTPIAQQVNKNRKKAHEALGWKTDIITVGPNPEDPGKAFTQALESGADGIWYGGYPSEAVAAQLKTAASKDVPVVGESLNDPTEKPFIAITRDKDDIDRLGNASAAKVAADSKGDAKVQLFGVSTFPTLAAYNDSFKKYLKEYCPKCSVDVNEVDFAEVGKGLPGQVVSSIQRNPDTNWVIFAFGDAAVGVEQALKSGGVADQVKIGGAIPGPAQLKALKDGSNAFWMHDVSVESMPWRETDLFARHFVGDTEGLEQVDEAPMVAQMLTPENIGDAPLDQDGWWTGFPGTVEAYKTMWQISG